MRTTSIGGSTFVVCRRLEAFDDRPEVTVMVRDRCSNCENVVAVPPEPEDGPTIAGTPTICERCYKNNDAAQLKQGIQETNDNDEEDKENAHREDGNGGNDVQDEANDQ